MKVHPSWLLFLLLCWVGCEENPQKPDQLIEEDKYVNLMVELQLVRSYAENADTDSVTVDSLKQQVLQKYGVGLADFNASHQYYQKFPQEQKNRVEQAIERLKMDQVGQRPARFYKSPPLQIAQPFQLYLSASAATFSSRMR
ncbi:MAG: DUF4296 domain-containing protein [Fodinibius sp.]|nr:DUF4296 domain-containing protein [Fodinibius sp.]